MALSALATVALADGTAATGPTVTTGAADSILSTAAALTATVNPNGLPTGVQFQFGTSTSYGSTTPIKAIGSGVTEVAVRSAVQGLKPSTTYHFRAVAMVSTTNTATGVAPVVGADQTFVTADPPPPPAPPVPTTGIATAITSTGATLNGTVNPEGTGTGVRFEYGTDTTYGTTTAPQSVGSGTADVPEQAVITGLKPSTVYHFRIVALRSAPNSVAGSTGLAVFNGADQTFTTADPSGAAPSLKLADATNVTATGATLHVQVTPNGAATAVHFEYGTSATYGQSTAVQNLDPGTAGISVAAPIAGLTAGQTYHFRAVATNSIGTTNGADQTFTTTTGVAGPPTATTGVATLITNTGATLNGTVNPNGGPSVYHFEFGRDATYGHSTLAQSAGAGTADVAVHAAIGELIPGTTYHFRVVAIAGASNTTGAANPGATAVDGADQTFTTTGVAPAPPTVTTGVATQITTTSAIANGVVNPNGTPTSYRVEYGLDTTYGLMTPTRLLGSGTTDIPVNAALLGLKPATTYHFRVVAVPANVLNTATTAPPINGADQTFTTLELAIGVFAAPAAGVTTTGATLNGGAYPNGNVTTVHFEYGTDLTYGTSTPDQVLTPTGDATATNAVVRVSAPVTGLAPHTVYHFRLVAKDGTQTRNSSDVTFRTGNTPPKVVNDSATLKSSDPLVIPVLSNDSDADGDTLTVTKVTQGTGGSVTINGDGTVTYTPGRGFTGRDAFYYRAEDGFGGGANALVTVQSALYLARGTYNGLISASTPANENSGYLRVTTTAGGAFTGVVDFAGREYPIRGAFDANGDFATTLGATANTVSRAAGVTPNPAGLSLALHLDATDGAQQITGTVTLGTTINSAVTAPRSPYGVGNPALQAGKYTLLVPAVTPVSNPSATPVATPTPGGTGLALMTVTPAGLVTVTGRLGDGSLMSTGAVLNGDGTFPLYAGLYVAPRGSFFGTITFRNVAKISDCDGSVFWSRPAAILPPTGSQSTLAPAALFPAGFAINANLIGSTYTAPDKGQRVLDLADATGNALLEFDDTTFAAPLDKTVTIRGANTVLPTTNEEAIAMSISRSNGYFAGYFGYPGTNATGAATTLLKTAFYGVVFQKQNFGGGVYVTGGVSGSVSLEAVAATPPPTPVAAN